MRVKNNSESVQMLPNFAAFEPGEERMVSADDGIIILRNRKFSQIIKEVKSEKSKSNNK